MVSSVERDALREYKESLRFWKSNQLQYQWNGNLAKQMVTADVTSIQKVGWESNLEKFIFSGEIASPRSAVTLSQSCCPALVGWLRAGATVFPVQGSLPCYSVPCACACQCTGEPSLLHISDRDQRWTDQWAGGCRGQQTLQYLIGERFSKFETFSDVGQPTCV